MGLILKRNKIVPIVFLWIGFVGAISFMEAWLKFQAPGITKELGLGIGSLVFSALNKVEIVFALLILVVIIRAGIKKRNELISVWIILVFFILILDSCWLLPMLDHRATAIINGESVPKSNLHVGYVGLEMVKVAALFMYGNQSGSMKSSKYREMKKTGD